MQNNKILIINSYFPTDPKAIDFDTTDLCSTVAAIGGVLDDNDYDSVVWMGDIKSIPCTSVLKRGRVNFKYNLCVSVILNDG